MLGFGTMPRPILITLIALAFLAAAQARPVGAAVIDLHARPNAFSPNGDGVRDSTTILWTIVGPADCLKLTIFGSGTGGHVVRRIQLGPRPAGPDSIVWDGTDSLGVRAPTQIYNLLLEQILASCDSDSVVSFKQAAVLLDVVNPPLPRIAHEDTSVTKAQFQVQGIAAFADTVVLFRDGARVDTVVTVPPDSAATFSFDVVLALGDNRFSVQAVDRAGNLSPQSLDVDVFYLNAPDITGVSAIPGTFSPNGDGRADSTRIQLTLDVPTTRLVVEARRGTAPLAGFPDATAPVALLYDGPAPAGTQSFPWDGTDSTGTITTDGEYVLVAQAESLLAGGTPIPGTRRSYVRVVLDTAPPPTPFVSPPPPAHSLRNQVALGVTMSESDSLRIFRDGVLLRTDAVSVSLSPKVSTHQVPLHTGTNLVTLQAIDVAGNLSAVSAAYTVVYDTPLGFHAPEKFGKGDVFGVNLETAASSVVIDLFTLRGTPVRQLSTTASASHYELPWDLKDASGNFVGDGPYLARLRVAYPNGTGAESKAAIVVVK
jgi:flagellar hook assembly protein FlgD